MANSYRQSTIKISFNNDFARPRAFEVEKFIWEEIRIDPQDLIGINFSITRSVVYLKLTNETLCTKIVQDHKNGLKFKHCDGNVGAVTVDHAGLGLRTVRIFELPFEVPADTVINELQPYGRVISHEAEKWTTFTKYPVLNGVRQIKIHLTKHVPSYLTIGGCRAIVLYDGQPKTCSGCGQEGHVRSECLQRRIIQVPTGESVTPSTTTILPLTYANARSKDVQLNNDHTEQMEDQVEASAETVVTPPGKMQQIIPTTKSEEHMEIDSQIVTTAAVIPDSKGDSNAHPQSDADTHTRKQRSPKRYKKRRRTPSDDSVQGTSGDEHTHDEGDGNQATTTDTSHQELHSTDIEQHQQGTEEHDTVIPPSMPQQSRVAEETTEMEEAGKADRTTNVSQGKWYDDHEEDPLQVANGDKAGVAPLQN